MTAVVIEWVRRERLVRDGRWDSCSHRTPCRLCRKSADCVYDDKDGGVEGRSEHWELEREFQEQMWNQ